LDPDENELVQRSRDEDTAAFGEIVRRYQVSRLAGLK
jgi:hypothetical protein